MQKESRIWGAILIGMFIFSFWCMWQYSIKVDTQAKAYYNSLGKLHTKTVEAPIHNNSIDSKLIQ